MQPDPVPTTGFQVPAPGRPVRGARAVRGPASVTVAALVANLVMSALGIVLVPLGDSILLREQRTSTDTAIINVYSAYLVVNLVLPFVTALAFILWLLRARATVEAWGIRGLGWGPGWAVGGWFVPLANLIVPKLVVDAAWSGALAPPGATEVPRRSSALINSWWALFLAANAAGIYLAQSDRGVEDGLAVYTASVAVVEGLNIAAGVLAIVMVRRITQRQVARQVALDG
jgi:hypothetical protein